MLVGQALQDALHGLLRGAEDGLGAEPVGGVVCVAGHGGRRPPQAPLQVVQLRGNVAQLAGPGEREESDSWFIYCLYLVV